MTCPLPFPLALMGGTDPAPTMDESGEEPGYEQPSTPPLSSRPSTEGKERTRLVHIVHAMATGSIRRRRRWTLFGLTVFAVSLAGVVFGGLATDRLLSIAPLPGGPGRRTAGLTLLLIGLVLSGWSAALFVRARGTPVPVNPPGGVDPARALCVGAQSHADRRVCLPLRDRPPAWLGFHRPAVDAGVRCCTCWS